jgi:hypothetical protein
VPTFASDRRPLLALTAALVAATSVVVFSGSAWAGAPARQRWQEVAASFEEAGAAPDDFYVAADAASALRQEVRAAGWRSPRVPGLVAALLATANPDGGYGLARPWDAYQDGTENPATTSYTATTVGHVGPILLAGFVAGAVPATAVNRVLDWVLALPRSADNPCIAYSASPNDLGQPCVWNVHFGAAVWVRNASIATGHRRAEAAALVSAVVSTLAVARIDPVTGYLPYMAGDTRPQDIGHQLWTALSIDALRGNRQAFDAMLAGSLWRQQVERSHDYNVASAVGGIALLDCRYATDPVVLRYAGSTDGGHPYAFKALAVQAHQVVDTCFAPSGGSTPGATPAVPGALVAQPGFGLG